MRCPTWCDDHLEVNGNCSFHQSTGRAFHGYEFLLVAPYPETKLDTIDDPGIYVYLEREGFPGMPCDREQVDVHLAEFRRQTAAWAELASELERAVGEVWG